MTQEKLPIIIAISGASGTVYGLRILQFLLENNYKIEFVISPGSSKVAQSEIGINLSTNPEILKEQVLSYLKLERGKEQLLTVWAHDDISASISSGSYKTDSMVIIPASMGTVARVAGGISDNLITRAADVCLKERRKLILVPREMPFSTIHLKNLVKLSVSGAIIAPASPAFYHNPKSLSELVDFVVGKVLDLLEIEHSVFKRWREKAKIYHTS